MKLLVLTTRLFGEPSSGGEVCSARLLAALAEAGHTLTLAGRGDAQAARRWAPRVLSLGALEPAFESQGIGRRAAALARALASGQAVTVQRLGGAALARRLATLRGEAFDAVVVDHLQAWPWLRALGPLPALLLNHNIESDLYQRRAREANRGCNGNPRTRLLERYVMQREAQALRRLEADALAGAAAVACLSEADAERLASIARARAQPPRARLHVLGGYPLRSPLAHPWRRAAGTALPRVGMLGTWSWAPNRRGLAWFLGQVWPLLAGRAELCLAGSGAEGLPLPAGVRLIGTVADPLAFYQTLDVVAIAALGGSGVQEKAIEALGSGVPVVATGAALRGLGTALPPQLHCADAPADFAAACLAAAGTGHPADTHDATTRWAGQRRRAYAAELALCVQALGPPAQPVPAAGALPAWPGVSA